MTPAEATAPTITELLATPSALREWLEKQPAGAIVGTGSSAESCPNSNFLKESGCCYASTGKHDVQWRMPMGDYHQEPSDWWLRAFVLFVDRLYGCAPVTAAEALVVLGRIEREAVAA